MMASVYFYPRLAEVAAGGWYAGGCGGVQVFCTNLGIGDLEVSLVRSVVRTIIVCNCSLSLGLLSCCGLELPIC